VKGVLPWLVCWACHAGTRYFCSALAALVGPILNIFPSPYTISILLSPPPSKLDRQPCWVACLSVCVSGDEAAYPNITCCSLILALVTYLVLCMLKLNRLPIHDRCNRTKLSQYTIQHQQYSYGRNRTFRNNISNAEATMQHAPTTATAETGPIETTAAKEEAPLTTA
jgi:hypothetical protein